MQQQMMMQHNMMIQQQMMLQQQMVESPMLESKKVDIIFQGDCIKPFSLSVEPFITVKELCNKFKKRVEKDLGLKKGLNDNYFTLLFNAQKIDTNSLTKIKNFFGICLYAIPKITFLAHQGCF